MNEKEKSAELLEYFNGLSLKEVLELARKSFILLDENTKFEAALVEIKKLIDETCWDYTDISIIPVKDKILKVINEVLSDEIHN